MQIDEGDSAFTAVFPWLHMRQADGGAVTPLNQEAGKWRFAAADLCPATPMPSEPMPSTVISRTAGER
ncbi:MAG: hypothetical protein MO852_06205, partial [Candidatus Devosia euplotis]|nr:hypothetical protein [Candidatus Devosia euplotis]